MYVAVNKVDSVGIREPPCSVVAIKYLGIYDVNVVAGIGMYALASTAINAHLLDLDITAFFEIKSSAVAGILFLRMTYRETGDSNVFAANETKHVRTERNGFKSCCGRIGILGLDSQIFNIVDDERRTIR